MIFLFFDTEFTRFSNPDVVRFSSIESFTYFSGDQDEDFATLRLHLKNNIRIVIKYKTVDLAKKCYIQLIELIDNLSVKEDF